MIVSMACRYEDCFFFAMVMSMLVYGLQDCKAPILKLIPTAFFYLMMDFVDV
jgi:hypothetical protein